MKKDRKNLRWGYSTGACAAAVATAAWLRLTRPETPLPAIPMLFLDGRERILPLLEPDEGHMAAIRKDGGDDPDVTDGALIFARVERTDTPGIIIDGGEGVGRVTLPGLDQPVGEAAINSTPRRMIAEQLEAAMARAGYPGGLRAVISVPEGEALAKRTFNPRLGIVGGISILGTSGIVKPMSEAALVETIHRELDLLRGISTFHEE